MIAQSIDVVFNNYGLNAKTINCDYVRFGIEFIGEIVEMFDDSLVENYRNVRQTIELKLKIDLVEALYVAAFLSATEKTLHIDNVIYEVVNDAQKVAFDFFKESRVGVHPVLKFKCKKTGVATPDIIVGNMGIGTSGVIE